MSVSSIGASAPVRFPNTDAAPKLADDNQTGDADEARDRAAQPPAQAALPPGQGPRINVMA